MLVIICCRLNMAGLPCSTLCGLPAILAGVSTWEGKVAQPPASQVFACQGKVWL